MIKIILKDNENGYEEVEKVVDKFVEKYGYGSIIVKIALARTPEEMPDIYNELLLFEGFDEGFIWENDWWEGEKYIVVVAIDFVADVIISGCRLTRMEKEDNITEDQYRKALKFLADSIIEWKNLPETKKENEK